MNEKTIKEIAAGLAERCFEKEGVYVLSAEEIEVFIKEKVEAARSAAQKGKVVRSVKKSDWALVKDAEALGLMVGMTGLMERNRTALNEELGSYFRSQLPEYSGIFDKDEEEILYAINEYLEEHKIDKHPLAFPISHGTDIHLIPVNENIQLKVVVVDEYFGDGDFSKYVMADFFLINEHATKEDVDGLIAFVNEVLM